MALGAAQLNQHLTTLQGMNASEIAFMEKHTMARVVMVWPDAVHQGGKHSHARAPHIPEGKAFSWLLPLTTLSANRTAPLHRSCTEHSLCCRFVGGTQKFYSKASHRLCTECALPLLVFEAAIQGRKLVTIFPKQREPSEHRRL